MVDIGEVELGNCGSSALSRLPDMTHYEAYACGDLGRDASDVDVLKKVESKMTCRGWKVLGWFIVDSKNIERVPSLNQRPVTQLRVTNADLSN